MSPSCLRAPRLHPQKGFRPQGFTLVELCAATAVLAVLASLALPSLSASVRKARRLDAMHALAQAQASQERWRAEHPSYAQAAEQQAPWPSGLGIHPLSAAGYYRVTVASEPPPDDSSFTLQATAVAGTGQDLDTAGGQSCAVLTLTVREGVATPSPLPCWPR